ncbi:MAG: hypothetical protein J6Z79_07590 [Clostridia bacterium]|nr:hypothetical protein [Clostridia bacterium]
MTNLDKILERIRLDGEERAIALDRETDEALLRLKTEADEQTARDAAAIRENAEKDARKIVTLANSAAVALRKKKALEVKSRALSDAVDEALAALARLSEDDYAELVLSLIERNTDGTPGEVLLASGRPVLDRGAFAQRLAALPGRNLTLSKKSADIPTGALVSYGRIQVDLSFEAVAAERRDAIRDRLADMIFRDAAKE